MRFRHTFFSYLRGGQSPGCLNNAEWSSPVARRGHIPEVGGSNPSSAITRAERSDNHKNYKRILPYLRKIWTKEIII